MHCTRRTLLHDDRERRFIEISTIQPGVNAVRRVDTLVLFLHGSLQSGRVARTFSANTFDQLASDECIVVYPDGIGRHFNDLRRGFNESARRLNVDDVGFLNRLIESYNPKRVIGCGFSNGGQMLLRMLCEAPAVLNGVALFGASVPTSDNLITSPKRWVPTPILSVQGTADPIVPYEGGHAGLGPNNRGTTRSAIDSARALALLNKADQHTKSWRYTNVRVDTFTGPEQQSAPVELWSIEGMGHLVPAPRSLDARLGPGTDTVVGAELVRDFFDL